MTATSYLVLGCLASIGPSTPYELKQVVAGGVGYFWSFPHSQLYSEPVRLAKAGLLTEHREEGGRRRRRFSITEAGRQELRQWLADPTSELPDIRDVGLLKLFFGALADPDHITALAHNQREAHQRRFDLYASVNESDIPGPPGATLRFGLAYERAATTFWDS
ncbi:MAG: hypothetical protein QOH91_1151, partial [Mycobacterium sp.]|nr:hypothetical protein [Mycobacterium sp.]